MKVYAVIRIPSIMESYQVGLYSSMEKAVQAAEEIARENSYHKISSTSWGEQDEYGILEGVSIVETEVQ